jgi:hypothetical protein
MHKNVVVVTMSHRHHHHHHANWARSKRNSRKVSKGQVESLSLLSLPPSLLSLLFFSLFARSLIASVNKMRVVLVEAWECGNVGICGAGNWRLEDYTGQSVLRRHSSSSRGISCTKVGPRHGATVCRSKGYMPFGYQHGRGRPLPPTETDCDVLQRSLFGHNTPSHPITILLLQGTPHTNHRIVTLVATTTRWTRRNHCPAAGDGYSFYFFILGNLETVGRLEIWVSVTPDHPQDSTIDSTRGQ